MSKPTPRAIFEMALESTENGTVLNELGLNHYRIYFNELTEIYGLPKNFREVNFIETRKGDEIGLIADLSLHFLNYHLLAKFVSECEELSEIVNRTLGGHILENPRNCITDHLNQAGSIINANSLGEDWREQAIEEYNYYWESIPPSQCLTTVIIGGEDE